MCSYYKHHMHSYTQQVVMFFNNEVLVPCVLRFAVPQHKSSQSSCGEGLQALSPSFLPSLDSEPWDMFGFGCFEVAGFVNLLLHPVLIKHHLSGHHLARLFMSSPS